MPIVLHRNIDTNTQLAIWKMSESLEELQHSLVSIPENIKSNKRQKEWICVRLLLNYLVPNTKEGSRSPAGGPPLDRTLASE